MAAYQKSLNTLYGHSVNDTIPPADATTKGYYRYDTDKEHYYQNQTGSAWTLILTGPNAVAAFANKTLDLRANTTLRQCRYGVYVPSEESKAVGQGVLAGLVGIGDKGTSTQNTGGKYDVWSTKAVANDCAGVVKLDTFTCWRNANPLLRFAWLYPGNTTNKRMFKGAYLWQWIFDKVMVWDLPAGANYANVPSSCELFMINCQPSHKLGGNSIGIAKTVAFDYYSYKRGTHNQAGIYNQRDYPITHSLGLVPKYVFVTVTNNDTNAILYCTVPKTLITTTQFTVRFPKPPPIPNRAGVLNLDFSWEVIY